MDFCALVNVECGTPWSVRDRNASSDYDGGRAHKVITRHLSDLTVLPEVFPSREAVS